MAFPKVRFGLHPKTLILGSIFSLVLLLLFYWARPSLGDRGWLAIGLGLGCVIFLQLESYYRSLEALYRQDEKFQMIVRQQSEYQARRTHDYYQIESLFSIFSLLRLRHPLPPMREWAISPDFAKQLIMLIDQHQPQLILEVSSGISTVIMGYCLQTIGHGQILSLEHDQRYARVSQTYIQNHDLQEIATVIHAPLTPIELHGQSWHWYDRAALQKLPGSIDLLVIDGPPGDLQPLSRYPALPLLFQWLSPEAVVIIDDGDRADEQEIVARWQREFGLEVDRVESEKGAFVLRRSRQSARSGFVVGVG